MSRRAKGGVSGRASAFFLLCRGAASDADWASARATVGLAVGHSRGAGKGDPNRLIGRFRLDPFRRGCDLAEVVELGESLILDGYSARKFDPPESRNLNRLARRSASTLRAE